MSPNVEFPKPLPKLIKQNYALDSGFIPNEIVALQNGWRLIKRCLHYHSMKISTDFFSENYLLLEKFRDVETKKFNLNSLHQHTHQIMNFYGHLIENGLNDVAIINMLLSNLVNRHKLYGITYDELKLITNYIKQYVIDFLDKIKSATLLNGLDKLTELIDKHHRGKEENGDNTSNVQSAYL